MNTIPSGNIWAIERRQADSIVGMMTRLNTLPNAAAVQAAREAANSNMKNHPRPQGNIVVLPLFGLLTQRATWLTAVFGGTPIEDASSIFAELVAASGVAEIVLLFDSGGGTVEGVPEFADQIFAARKQKTVTAMVDSCCCSAAYWLASACSKVVCTPSGMVGSVGVFSLHLDISGALEQAGVTPTYISAGRFKVEGAEEFPLTQDAAKYMQSLVDDCYRMFVQAVAKYRSHTAAFVATKFGEGRIVTPTDAVAAGMIDGIQPFRSYLAASADRIAKGRDTVKALRAAHAKRKAETIKVERTAKRQEFDRYLRDAANNIFPDDDADD